jgi:branched-subunit amino acid ABC-type transport system permease component
MGGNEAWLVGISILTTGLLLGSVFALAASGVTIVYGSIWLPNASNGQFFLLAPLIAWLLVTSFGLSTPAAAGLALLIGIPFCYFLEATLIRRFYDVPNRNIAYFMVTLGLTQVLSGLLNITFGQWSDQFALPPIISGISWIGPFPMPNNRILAMALALLLLLALFCFMRYHRFGRALRAVFQNREAAALRGVNVRGLYRTSFLLGTLMVFAAGLLYGMALSFDLSLAWNMAVTVFAIMIVGGPGSVLGAVVIGMIFGFTQAGVSAFATPTIASFAYLGVMLLVLLLKPDGLFAR